MRNFLVITGVGLYAFSAHQYRKGTDWILC